MLIRIHTVQPSVLLPVPVLLEVNISRGIKFHLSGNVHTSIKENRQRIYATLKNEGWHWPGQRITLNFRPLELLKKGSHYDLPMAIGILGASGQISTELLNKTLFFGAIQLDGTIEPSNDAHNILETAYREGLGRVVVHIPSKQMRRLSAEYHMLEIVNISTLKEAIEFLQRGVLPPAGQQEHSVEEEHDYGCFSEVKGLDSFKYALEIAATGGHHALLKGAPGIGKTMLLNRFPSILPPISAIDKSLLAMLCSGTGGSTCGGRRPFIKTMTDESIKSLFGSKEIQALKDQFELTEGEVFWRKKVETLGKATLGKFHSALGGVLFLDELPTLSRGVLDALLLHMDRYRTQMVMAMNPCHCGYFNHPEIDCSCTASNLHRYQGVLSGALLDRIDLQLIQEYSSPKGKSETSETIRTRVLKGYKIQMDRCGRQNARLTLDDLKPLVLHNNTMKRTFLNHLKVQKWSLRKQRSLLSVVLTIADLDSHIPEKKHLEEAVRLSRFIPAEEGTKKSSSQYQRPTIVLGPGMKVRQN